VKDAKKDYTVGIYSA